MSTIAQSQGSRRGPPAFSLGVEIANAITHGLGAALSVAALVILVAAATARGDGWYVTAYAVFGASAFFLYMASTLYHAIQAPRAKRVFEIFDHGAIFVLIAGSYTAFALTILRSSVGWWLFGAVWAIAAAGIVVEALFLNRWPFATLAGYLSMGWLIVLVWKPLNEYGSPAMVGWLFAGGACYTLGTVFYALGRKRGWFHPAWHLFVLGGSACHFFAALAALPS